MTRKQALQYVKNTNGGATVAHFVDDWAPVGSMEWKLLTDGGLAEERNGRIYLTEAGEAKLTELDS